MAAPPIPAPLFSLRPRPRGPGRADHRPLITLIARRFLREPRLIPLIIPLCTRINHARHRFERLMARLAAGRPPLTRTFRGRAPRGATQQSPTGRPRLPCGHGWLLRPLGYEVAAYASQLEAVLAEPAAAELLAQFPAAGRILHPIRWILGFIPRAPRRRTVRAHRPPRRRPRRHPCHREPPRRGPGHSPTVPARTGPRTPAPLRNEHEPAPPNRALIVPI